MEKDEIRLIDYLRVIWRRKILLILGTLVFIIVGVVISFRLPVTYRVDAVLRIGKIAKLQTSNISNTSTTTSSTHFSVVTLEDPTDLAQSILIRYGQNINEGYNFDLGTDVIDGTSMVKITAKGPDRRVATVIKEITKSVIDEHDSITKRSIQSCQAFIEKQKKNISDIQNELTQEELTLEENNMAMDKEMKKLMFNGKGKEKNLEVDIDDAAFTLMTVQSRLMAIQNNALKMTQIVQKRAEQGHITIRALQDDIFSCQLTINSLKENKTRLVGELMEICVRPNKRLNILLAGLAGLIVSLFLAFFKEYLEKVRDREKGNEGEI